MHNQIGLKLGSFNLRRISWLLSLAGCKFEKLLATTILPPLLAARGVTAIPAYCCPEEALPMPWQASTSRKSAMCCLVIEAERSSEGTPSEPNFYTAAACEVDEFPLTGCGEERARTGGHAAALSKIYLAVESAPAKIVVGLHPEEDTRTPSKFCLYTATCEIDGITYTARSRNGASYELARVLIEAGVPDQPMYVRQQGLNGEIVFPSIYEAANWTIRETATGMYRARWEDPAAKRARIDRAFGEKQGGTDPPAMGYPTRFMCVNWPLPIAPVRSAADRAECRHDPRVSAPQARPSAQAPRGSRQRRGAPVAPAFRRPVRLGEGDLRRLPRERAF